MPTEVIKVVDPDNGSGTDYTSLSAWEAGEQQDLVTNDRIATAKCRCTSGSADTTAVTINGWTTDSTHYIKIWTDPNENYRHDGKWNGTKYRLEINDWESSIIYILEANVRIEGLQFKTTGGGKQYFLYFYILASGEACKWYVSKNIFYKGTSSVDNAVKYLPYDSGNTYTYNNIFIDVDVGIYTVDWSNTLHCIYNNTFHSLTTYGIRRYATGEVRTRNNLFKSCATDTYNLTASNQDYNATNNSSLGYEAQAHDRLSQTFAFVDEANDDFHLASTDTGARNYGANLSSDPYLSFSDDIDGQTRPGETAWDIGADEYVPAGGAFKPYWSHNSNVLIGGQP